MAKQSKARRDKNSYGKIGCNEKDYFFDVQKKEKRAGGEERGEIMKHEWAETEQYEGKRRGMQSKGIKNIKDKQRKMVRQNRI